MGFAELALEVAFVRPVEQFEVATEDDEPWWHRVGLDHIAEFWIGVFEAGGRVARDAVLEDLVELAGFDLGVTTDVDLGRELKDLGGVAASDGAGEKQRCPRDKIKRSGDSAGNFVTDTAVFFGGQVPFGDDDDQAFARFFDDTG